MEVFVIISVFLFVLLVVCIIVNMFGDNNKKQETSTITEQENKTNSPNKRFWDYCFVRDNEDGLLIHNLHLNVRFNVHQQILLYLILSYKQNDLYPSSLPYGLWDHSDIDRYRRKAKTYGLVYKHIISPAKYDTAGFCIEEEKWKWVLSPKGEEFVETYMAEFEQIFKDSQK